MTYTSYSTTFEYLGTRHKLVISNHYAHSGPGLTSKHSFSVTINNVHQGYITRDEKGFWSPLDKTPIYKQSPKRIPPPFELEANDWQVIGEIIELELGEWV